MKKNLIVTLSVCLFLVCSSGLAMAKTGYINVQKIVSESNIGKEAQKDLATLRAAKEKQVQASLSELKVMKDAINKKTDDMEKLQAKIDAFQKKVKAHQRLVADIREELARADRDLVARILNKADAVLKKVAKKGKYDLIVKDANVLGYIDPKVDITDKVIKELNKKK